MKLSLRTCRVNANLTRQELADLLGVTVNTINNWENNNTTPNAQLLIDFARVCAVKVENIRLGD